MQKNMNFKKIHIGRIVEARVKELKIPIDRIVRFMYLEAAEIKKMYTLETMDSGVLLRWSKLLEYDFFRLYSQNLILYSPSNNQMGSNSSPVCKKSISLPVFRKNIYTKQMIEFIIELIDTKEKTAAQIIADYNIPKTTLYTWMKKYKE